jgi:hypothetical protein
MVPEGLSHDRMTLPTFADIEAARDRLKGEAVVTPLLESALLNAAGRADPDQGGVPAAHRIVQVPRRLELHLKARRGGQRKAASLPIRRATMPRAWRPRRVCAACRR